MTRFTVFHSLDLDRGKDERISDCCRSDDVWPRDLLQRFTLHVLGFNRFNLEYTDLVFCCPVIFLEGGRRLPRRGVFVCVSFPRHLTRQQCDSRGSEFSSCSIYRWHCSVARASFVQLCALLQRQISNIGMRCLEYIFHWPPILRM